MKQPMRCLLRRRWTVLSLLLVVLLLWLLMPRGALWCSQAESLSILSTACQDFHAGRISGNRCTEMCLQFTLVRCSNYREGKIVLVGEWYHEGVVLKSAKSRITQYDSLNINQHLVKRFLQEKKFHAIVRQSLLYNSGYTNATTSDEFLSDFFMGNVSTQADINSLWSLLQQEEFVLLHLFPRKSFPRILGVCGHFYFVEKIAPISPDWRLRVAWRDTAILALKYLDFVEDISPLHFCDMKQENFGIASVGTLKALDVDMVVTDTRLGSIFGDQHNCTSDTDCAYFDCKGFCDTNKKLCLRTRKNSNFQAVCEKIFLPSFSNLYAGLLQRIPDIPVRGKLESLLSLCVNLTQSDCVEISCHSRYEDFVFRNLYKTIAESIAWNQI